MLADSPALERIAAKLGSGGMVVAIAAAAQAAGRVARAMLSGEAVAGFGWLPESVVEPNFDPGHDRRLRQLVESPGVADGVGLAAGSALLLGPGERAELLGSGFLLDDPAGDLALAEAHYARIELPSDPEQDS